MRQVKWGWWVALAVCVLLGTVAYWPGLLLPLLGVPPLQSRVLAPSSLITDRNGQRLYELIDPHAGLHRPLALEQIPLALRQAIIATEDASFYRNPGVDLRAIARALWTNLRGGTILSGGSTITQQLARNLLLDARERYSQSWQRKLRESFLAYYLTRTLSKDEILALYLNETYFGNLAYGVEAAAQVYFAKPVSQLDLAECALLAGLPQSPVAYNPLTDLPAAQARQKVVLGLMVKAGYLSAEQAALAAREPLRLASAPLGLEAPHFSLLVREELVSLLGEETVRRGGLRVQTTLDLDLQHAAEQHVRRHLAQLNRPAKDLPGHNVQNAAVVVLDANDGAVRVMVGSPDYYDARTSGAVNAALALRQPGSAIKPLTYAAAFARGYSPASMFTDVRTSFLTREGTPYVPVNYDYRFHGPVLLRQALACSYNVVAVKLLDRIGLDALTTTARQLGITSLDRPERQGLSLTLGGGEVRLLELTAAYAAFANGGGRVRPYLIEQVQDSAGRVLYRTAPQAPTPVLDARVAYLISDVLSDPQARLPAFGANSALELPFPAAVKTGTTTAWRDNWTVGYTRELVTGVWVGNADGSPMFRVSGISGAAPIWNAVMRSAHRRAPQGFERPTGLVEVEVCAESGQLPQAACLHRRRELFLAENAPHQTCTLHRLVTFDAATGAVAGESCPAERRITRAVTFWPADALAWAEEEGLPLPPALAATDPAGEMATAVASAPEGGLALASPDPHGVFLLASELPERFQALEVVATCPPEMVAQPLDLWVDGQRWHTWTAPPYRALWPLAPGVHEFRLEGRDARGNTVRSAPVSITVLDGHEGERNPS